MSERLCSYPSSCYQISSNKFSDKHRFRLRRYFIPMFSFHNIFFKFSCFSTGMEFGYRIVSYRMMTHERCTSGASKAHFPKRTSPWIRSIFGGERVQVYWMQEIMNTFAKLIRFCEDFDKLLVGTSEVKREDTLRDGPWPARRTRRSSARRTSSSASRRSSSASAARRGLSLPTLELDFFFYSELLFYSPVSYRKTENTLQ